MELGCQQVDFFKLGHSLSECTEFIGRHYLLIQLITVKGFRHLTIKKKKTALLGRLALVSARLNSA